MIAREYFDTKGKKVSKLEFDNSNLENQKMKIIFDDGTNAVREGITGKNILN